MLKKLVKYGNSNALVLDKALLELLNIEEGSVVKLRTDGTSLIITAQHHIVSQEKVARTVIPQDTLQEAINKNLKQNYENADAYVDEIRKVYTRYADITKRLYTPEIAQKFKEIEQRFNGDRTNPKFLKEMHLLQLQYVPELEQMDYEIEQISQKYGHKQYKGKFTNDVIAFKKVHEKYRHVLEQAIKLNENPEYIHESVLLAEKYQATKNSPEYIQEQANLITRYIPEYATYQNELKVVGELLK